jgi:NADH dehydrogenase FAD-containing subunit
MTDMDPVLVHRVETLERRTDKHSEMLDNLTSAVDKIDVKMAAQERRLLDIIDKMDENQRMLIRWLLAIVGGGFTGMGLLGVV